MQERCYYLVNKVQLSSFMRGLSPPPFHGLGRGGGGAAEYSRNKSNMRSVGISAWIGSIAFGMNFLCGPIASSLCQRFGYRIVAAVGGLIAALGLLLTSFTNSLYLIYLTYSVLWGFGSSLNYAPTMLVLGELM